jgi:hypothetical protein
MITRIVLSLLSATVFVCSLFAQSNPSQVNVILIGWDGAQRAHVEECLRRNELPVLAKLSAEGGKVDITVVGTTDTKAGWSQILTGYNPDVTGVYSNRKYGAIPKGLSIFSRLEEFFGDANIFTGAVIGKKGHVDADGPEVRPVKKLTQKECVRLARKLGGELDAENGIHVIRVPAKPHFYVKDEADLFENGLIENRVVGERALEVINQHRTEKFFLFVHFAEVDKNGHMKGENSAEYTEALRSCDLWTGRIIERLKECNIYTNTFIYVTADHGFDEGAMRHQNAPDIFLSTNDPNVTTAGTRADITPTILWKFGVDVSVIQPPLAGRPLQVGK